MHQWFHDVIFHKSPFIRVPFFWCTSGMTYGFPLSHSLTNRDSILLAILNNVSLSCFRSPKVPYERVNLRNHATFSLFLRRLQGELSVPSWQVKIVQQYTGHSALNSTTWWSVDFSVTWNYDSLFIFSHLTWMIYSRRVPPIQKGSASPYFKISVRDCNWKSRESIGKPPVWSPFCQDVSTANITGPSWLRCLSLRPRRGASCQLSIMAYGATSV